MIAEELTGKLPDIKADNYQSGNADTDGNI